MFQRIDVVIRDLDLNNPEQMTGVYQRVRERGLEEITEVVRIIHEGNQKEAKNARAVVKKLGDLAIGPMLEHLSFDKPADLKWDMRTIVSFQLENRTKIVTLLDEMLLETTVVPSTMNPLEVEEMPPKMRLCDHAYLLMRQLFALEDEETEFINKDLYLNLTDDERDEEITLARESKKWSNLIEAE